MTVTESIAADNVLAALREWLAENPAKTLARHVGVEITTVSRWKLGHVIPRPRHMEDLAQFLCLPADWRERPYAAEGLPLVHQARVKEIGRLAEQLPPQTLTELYPALMRLLRP